MQCWRGNHADGYSRSHCARGRTLSDYVGHAEYAIMEGGEFNEEKGPKRGNTVRGEGPEARSCRGG